jgi:L-arabinokinase
MTRRQLDQAQGEAPGRLDFLGGVADYSGSLVLQMPIRARTRVTITPLAEPRLELISQQEGATTLPLPCRTLMEAAGDLVSLPPGADATRLAKWLDEQQAPHWARYPVGCLLLFCRHQAWQPPGGLKFAIASEVPISMGVSSSAALEVATLRALEEFSSRRFQGTALARLAQRAENDLVGAPCGLMDQLAAAHGVSSALLPILCRPDVLDDPVPLPAGAVVVGWPSGVRHAVSGSPYATARAAAFMGKKILERALARRLAHVTELTPAQVAEVGEAALPRSLSGEEFLARHGGVDDPLSRIDPGQLYPVRAAVNFPVDENVRAAQAVRLLRGVLPANRQHTLKAVGELMYHSHAGYGAMGLGCPETDMMVQAVRQRGPDHGFYGARVSGGGSGGTVVVLLEAAALPQLEELATTLCLDGVGPSPLIV